MANLSLYYKTILETSVSLLPDQINQNIDENLLKNLKTKVEGKSTENGIEIKIVRLIDYNYGIIDKSNFMGTTVFKVKYECFVCAPVADLEIVCLINNIVKGYYVASNGPLVVVIPINNIDFQKFEISNDMIQRKHKEDSEDTKETIVKGQYVKVSIINIKNNYGDAIIVSMCKLIDIASDAEIEKFKGDQNTLSNKTEIDSDEFI